MEQQYNPPQTKLDFESNKRFHVFLSFRGPEVRKTLVDHLYQALSTVGFNVFLDSDELEKGEMIGLSLEAAIKSSAIHIPIFSVGYADSTWCLREAAEMLKTPGLIIPLYYHVDPTHVRYPLNETSSYRQAFLRHYAHSDGYPREEIQCWKHAIVQICPCLNFCDHSVRHSREEIDGWKEALQQISSRSGWSMDRTQGFEGRLVKMVVHDLIKTFYSVPLQVAHYPVGLDSVKDAVIRKLNMYSMDEVVKVGIWGPAGIGKTLLSEALFNQVSDQSGFEFCSVVYNVGAIAADPRGLTELQGEILRDLGKCSGGVDSVDQGIALFRDRSGRKRVRPKPVLLILDGVDSVEQLNALVGDWLAHLSKVIITTRNKHVLDVAGVSSECIHEMRGLEINEGLRFFGWHAFLKKYPTPNYEDLSKKIVKACNGNPLLLKVIGSHLYDKQNDTDCWMEALRNITRYPEIQDRLYISYAALNDEEKEIFMDIACFFSGEEKSFPITFWKSMYNMVNSAVSNLLLKSLIKINDGGRFCMDDPLRDMGRSIAEKEKECTRLWEATRLSTISNNINFSRIRINGGNSQRLEKLYRPGLRYLHLQNVTIEGMTQDPLAKLPTSLIWLRLEGCHFEMNGAIKKPRHSNDIWQLKIMQLQSCDDIDSLSMSSVFSLPDIQLQHLNIERCHRLKNLHDSIGNLSQLQHLNIQECTGLKNLHDSIDNLSQLQHLNIQECTGLKNLPDSIGNLSQLQHLNIRRCGGLENLPDSIGNLSQLQHLNIQERTCLLNIQECTGLKSLPDSIGNLSKLQHLNINCEGLKKLPNSIGNLSQLQHLNIQECTGLKNLPDSIGNLSQLQHLNIRRCGGLENLPDSIGTLSQLQHLNIERCHGLNNLSDSIGNLSQLQHLNIEECTGLKNLPDSIGNLSQLQHLNIRWCGSLKNLPDSIGNLSQLQHLRITGCRGLKSLPDSIRNLSQLQHLDLLRIFTS